MKTLKKITFLILFTAIVAACGSNDDVAALGSEGSLTATIDGNAFEAMPIGVAATLTNNVLVVQGSNASGAFVRINLTNYNGVGTYVTGNAISNVNSIMYGTVNPIVSWVSTFDQGTGTIEITEDTSTTVKGTFSFTGINTNAGSKTVTNGMFTAPKQ